MSKESDVIETQKSKAQRDSRRKYAFMNELQMANDPLECALLLGRLNEAISTLCALQDSYYTEYIWNSNNSMREGLEKEGLTEDVFYTMEMKLSKLREILMGGSLNWDEVYQNLYLNAIGHEVYWHEFYENRVRELETKIKKMEKGKA